MLDTLDASLDCCRPVHEREQVNRNRRGRPRGFRTRSCEPEPFDGDAAKRSRSGKDRPRDNLRVNHDSADGDLERATLSRESLNANDDFSSRIVDRDEPSRVRFLAWSSQTLESALVS